MLNQIRFLLAVVCVISKVFDKAWWESKGVSTQESKIKTSPYSGDLTVQVGCKYQYRQVTPAMKWDWRVTTVIKRLRKLHKMTTQIMAQFGFEPRLLMFSFSLDREWYFRGPLAELFRFPQQGIPLCYILALLQNLKKIHQQLLLPTDFWSFFVLKISLLVRLCNPENDGVIFSTSTIWTSKDKKGTLTSTQKHFGALWIPQCSLGN